MKKYLFSFLMISLPLLALAQQEELIKFGDFEQWMKRDIKESAVIGGQVKTLYEIAPYVHWNKANGKLNKPYRNIGGSPWATSNIYARVSGINKTNSSVFRDRHNEGYCVKLTTHIESVEVLGLLNISVLASGSIFTGEMMEPITGTDNPMSKMDLGIPFTGRPKYLKLDYRVRLTGEPNRIRQTGFSKVVTVPGKDMPEVFLYLQHRTETPDGKIIAKRVATMVHKFSKTTNGWVEGECLEIHYGDITSKPFYNQQMALKRGDNSLYARNSKGKHVIIDEVGWADPSEAPTHAIIKFDSSHGGAYIGSIGTTLWLDNIKWVY
jgi:hypothetical protein